MYHTMITLCILHTHGATWSSPRKMDTGLRVVRVVRPLEFLRRQEPQGGVSADAVVKRLHVLEDACPCLLSGRVRLVVDQLPLQRGEDALHRRVVPALRHPAHAAGDALPGEEALAEA